MEVGLAHLLSQGRERVTDPADRAALPERQCFALGLRRFEGQTQVRAELRLVLDQRAGELLRDEIETKDGIGGRIRAEQRRRVEVRVARDQELALIREV